MYEPETVDTICANCHEGGCTETCQCCGAPLCDKHWQREAGLCKPCLKLPPEELAKHMTALDGPYEETLWGFIAQQHQAELMGL